MKPSGELASLADKIFLSAAVGMGVLILLTYLTGLSVFVFSTAWKHEKVIHSSFESMREELTVAVYNNRITNAYRMNELPEITEFEQMLRVNDVEAEVLIDTCRETEPDETQFHLSLLPGMNFKECVYVAKSNVFVIQGVIWGCLLAAFSLLISCLVWFLFRGRFKKVHLDPLILSLESDARDAAVGKMASQLAHDIRSPLAALNVFLKVTEKMPEDQRVLVRTAVTRIQDIANNLLPKTKKPELDAMSRKMRVELVPNLLEKLITEKRMQYKENSQLSIQFKMDDSAYSAFAKVIPGELMRVVSNLVNNAVEALDKNKAEVVVFLKADRNWVRVSVIDNGKGIPAEKLPKLMRKGASFDKKDGSGLGLAHARAFIDSLSGRIKIESEVGRGTKVDLHIPRTGTPDWFLSKIELKPGQRIIAIDDDDSIHRVWDERFNTKAASTNRIDVINLKSIKEAYAFMKDRNIDESYLFVVDFEFVGEEKSGIDFIIDHGLSKRSVLVSSRFEEERVQLLCRENKIRLIPKSLSPYTPVILPNAAPGVDSDDDGTWTKAVS